MRKSKPNRKARFKAALALRQMTQHQWAEKEKVTRQHLGAVLRDDRESGILTAKVDAFISEVEDEHKAMAA